MELIDWFAGIGGFRRGMEKAIMEIMEKYKE
jgi:site-specific DNA-cytosine methylase|nr:MAG TPA: 5-cytosine DNA methyltransferase [Caudoviricetes sp.]